MKYLFILLPLSSILSFSCNNMVKNDNPKVTVEDGTQIDSIVAKEIKPNNELLGTYVGMFEMDEDDSVIQSKTVYAGESFHWERGNKIALSIDSIANGNIKGHSVVAGNNRPFEGIINKTDTGFIVEAKEPGNDKHDGIFSFTLKDTIINGTWKAFAKIDIDKRKYTLIKKVFSYNAGQMLTEMSRYVDWTKPITSKEEKKKLKATMTKAEREEYEEFDEDTEFASATKKIYTINASNILLTENMVANLTKGDLLIIRNTIYARHGYSFKKTSLRVFFDKQDWYVPVYSDIKTDFTDIEKKNIPLLLKYEKLAKEYYDYFGRG